jgi:L-amino acid N-acyltransferase YncA
MIREVTIDDAVFITEIYNYYIENTVVTFEVEPISIEVMSSRILKYKAIGPYFVYEENEKVVGYSYISQFAERKAYQNTVEATIYLQNGYAKRGIGFLLYTNLLEKIKDKYHSVIGIIALPNDASVKLHEKCGFKYVGEFSEVGRKFDKWIDVGYWQKINP